MLKWHPMKLGVVIYSNDAETVFQAFRLGNYALSQGDAVKVFLLAKGVECEGLDNEKGTCSLIDLPTSLESGIQPIGSME